MADYVHSKGLKIGIYTGVGPKCVCALIVRVVWLLLRLIFVVKYTRGARLFLCLRCACSLTILFSLRSPMQGKRSSYPRLCR